MLSAFRFVFLLEVEKHSQVNALPAEKWGFLAMMSLGSHQKSWTATGEQLGAKICSWKFKHRWEVPSILAFKRGLSRKDVFLRLLEQFPVFL